MSALEEVRFPSARAEQAELPMNVWLDDGDSPLDVIDALALSPFATGAQPWARTATVERLLPDAALMPAGGRVVRAAKEDDGRDSRLVCGDGWTMRVIRWRDRSATVHLSAVSEELADRVIAETVKGAGAPDPEADHVRMGFWWRTDRGGRRSEKPITAAPWPEISANYARTAGRTLSRLLATTPEDIGGRLVLLHGPPGTGKTTLLRTLAREWGAWCQVDCVLDPEVLFHDLAYLMDVAVGFSPEEHEGKRWRLLVLEDCDELIGAGAKDAAGQGLSRLLNLTDGLLGQGRDVLVAITTNEELSRLHPAIVRPGRCLAEIEVPPLPREEAVAWLGTSQGVQPGGATLADLYALRAGRPIRPGESQANTGLYL